MNQNKSEVKVFPPSQEVLTTYAREIIEEAKKKQEPLLKIIYTIEAIVRTLTTKSQHKH